MTEPFSRRFDLIAFDWDGTLYDSTALIAHCIQDAVVDVGGARPSLRDAAWVIGLGLAEALARAAPDVPREKYVALGARYRYHYVKRQDDLVLVEPEHRPRIGQQHRRVQHVAATCLGSRSAGPGLRRSRHTRLRR